MKCSLGVRRVAGVRLTSTQIRNAVAHTDTATVGMATKTGREAPFCEMSRA